MTPAGDVRQLFDPVSSTFTYLLLARAGDERVDAVLVDPVAERLERDLALLHDLGATLRFVLETHVHADHVTSAGALRRRTGCRVGTPATCGVREADLQLRDGQRLPFGTGIYVLHTPGHTPGSSCYVWDGQVLTGDTLLIGGCGRTDFQGGDAGQLYDSVTGRLFTLPGRTLVLPGHDYRGRTHSCIADERTGNPRFAGRDRAAFVSLMAGLRLPPPARIATAPDANRRLGLDAPDPPTDDDNKEQAA